MVYVGVDLHRKRSHVVALDPTGQVLVSRRIGNAPAEFLRIFGELEPQPIQVAFEATYGWSWFADLLADAGIPAHMAHPLATKAISAARVKNDAVDAKTLAHLLRTNLLAEAWIAPPAAREARRQVRTRAGLVRMRSRVQSQLHALLADLGIIPELTTLFGRPAAAGWPSSNSRSAPVVGWTPACAWSTPSPSRSVGATPTCAQHSLATAEHGGCCRSPESGW
jgi:transposase